METTEKYLQFPLFLIRGMLINKTEVINKIIYYGIYKYSTKFSYTIKDASKNLMFYYYRKKDELTDNLRITIETYIEKEMIVIDEDYNGFHGKGFDPDTEIEQLNLIMEKDIDFRNKVIEFYQMQLSYSSLEITGNIQNCLKKGKEIEEQIPIGEPMPMISKSLLFDFRDNEKKEIDLIQLVSYIAVKSILGVKSFVKTNKMHIVCRMFGYSSVKHLPVKMPTNINSLFLKYSHRYHIDKVLTQLELNWNVLTYSNNIRGMYVAMSNKINIEQLVLSAETRKHKNRIAELKRQKKEATAKALEQLNKEQQLNKD